MARLREGGVKADKIFNFKCIPSRIPGRFELCILILNTTKDRRFQTLRRQTLAIAPG